jgi:dihydrofolate synthase/folylpolyglutamate synthase
MDHTEYLGDTLEKIAFEKASISKAGVPMVVSSLEPEAMSQALELTQKVGAPLRVLGRDFSIMDEPNSHFLGYHQRENAALAAEVFRLVRQHHESCTPDVFIKSLDSVIWPGRFEIINGEPEFILDGAHNLEATLALVATLEEQQIEPDTIVFGALKGKPYKRMLDLLRPLVHQVILVPPPIERAVDPITYALESDLIAGDSKEAIRLAIEKAGPNSEVLVTGSLFAVAAVRGILLGEDSDPPIGL